MELQISIILVSRLQVMRQEKLKRLSQKTVTKHFCRV